jgi:DNA-directed RNA polymerase specialized sigma24 family protein
MSATGWAERFDEHRARLRAVAYRMLDSVGEAGDAQRLGSHKVLLSQSKR